MLVSECSASGRNLASDLVLVSDLSASGRNFASDLVLVSDFPRLQRGFRLKPSACLGIASQPARAGLKCQFQDSPAGRPPAVFRESNFSLREIQRGIPSRRISQSGEGEGGDSSLWEGL